MIIFKSTKSLAHGKMASCFAQTVKSSKDSFVTLTGTAPQSDIEPAINGYESVLYIP